jgi:hypothetical protein
VLIESALQVTVAVLALAQDVAVVLDPPAGVQAAADVDLAVGNRSDRVNRWCSSQIGGRSNTHRG